MIQLHRDYLLVETSPDQIIPCSAEAVAVDLISESGSNPDGAVVQEAAAAVLHYFKEDLGWNTVTVGEFSRALAQALKALGVDVSTPGVANARVQSVDLNLLASGADRGWELSFFPQLRQVLRRTLGEAPAVVRFHGLRPCVKHLIGSKRWTPRCQSLNDQIVGYLRACLETEGPVASCELVIH